ncbi:hypothetical protein Tco_1289800, partial [Tanacetum coccineum]
MLPIPLPAPSTSCRADIPEADTPPRKRLLLTTPRPSCEVGESSAAAAARQPGPTMAHRVDYIAVLSVTSLLSIMENGTKRTTRSTPVTPNPNATATTTVTEAQLQALIDQGVATAMAEAEAARECSYSEFLKCKPLDFKGTEGVGIETEMWNLKVRGTDVVAYSRRFQQLALMCSMMFPEEIDKIEKYIGGLPDMIHGNVKASKLKTMQEAIEFTTELMDDKTQAYAERQAER